MYGIQVVTPVTGKLTRQNLAAERAELAELRRAEERASADATIEYLGQLLAPTVTVEHRGGAERCGMCGGVFSLDPPCCGPMLDCEWAARRR